MFRKLKIEFWLVILLLSLISCSEGSNAEKFVNSVVPKPQKMEVLNGSIAINNGDKVSLDRSNEQLVGILEYLNGKLEPASGVTLGESSQGGKINFVLKDEGSKEGYKLSVDGSGITITASQPAGIFYGVQTILQMLPAEIKSKERVDGLKLAIPYCQVEDEPSFEWRGLMLDVSRHWFTKEEVLAYIDQLAEFKMNVFHWHLTDDQGWRIEIKSRPELISKGCLRAERTGDWWQREPQREGEEATYGGYYTQEDVAEVVAYAAARFVTVVPEIDVPGHSLATLVAYPELACLKAPTTVNVGNKFYTIDENSLCVANPESYKFMEDVLAEVSAMFPSEYIHIGGDECWKGFWKKCPKCQKLMREEGYKNVEELQSYFIREMEQILKKDGKKLIGWDEIHEGGLAPEANVMSWRGMEGGIKAAQAGHHVVMTPTQHCYFDLYQGDRNVEPETYSICRLSDVYSFNPVPEGVDKKYILGGQGNLWGEAVPTFRHAEYMTWPRGWAMSEVLWSGVENCEWSEFVTRVEEQFIRADYADINYARSMYDPILTCYPKGDEDPTILITLSSEVEGLDIYYTFDNTAPDHHSPKFVGEEITIPEGSKRMKAVTYRDGKPIGKQIIWSLEQLQDRSKGQKRPVGNL